MTGFRDRAVVITGASSGIGRELALTLADDGARLALAARSADELEAVAADCRARGSHAVAVPTDVGDPDACGRLIETAVGELGGVDVLVNNAGIGMWARFDEVTDLSIFERIMRVNYLGSVYCTWYALPHLKARRGLVVAITSLTGKLGVPTRTGYAASKHAMHGFFDSLRIELRNTGVDVCVVAPGFVDTGIRDRVVGGDGQPVGSSKRDESRGNMTVADCTRAIVGAMRKRRRELVMTPQGKLGVVARLLAPRVVDEMAARNLDDPGK